MPATIGNPCVKSATTVANTGVECAASLGIAKGFYLVDGNLKWTSTDEANPVTWVQTQIHARNLFPVLQGIFDFAPTQESDVTEANPIAGTNKRRRAGGVTMLYTFDDGGLCLAKALKTFEGKGYRVIMVDQEGQMLRRKNADGTFSGLKTNDISSAIIFASASVSFKNTVSISVSQDEIIKYADLISVNDGDISDNNGLLDVQLTDATGSSVTLLKFGVETECAGTDLVAEYDAALADLDLYIVRKADGTVVTPTAIAVVSGHIQMTGTFTAGVYTITPTTPAVWLTNNISGFDGSNGAVSITTA